VDAWLLEAGFAHRLPDGRLEATELGFELGSTLAGA
jgi:hypothetical protein